MDKDTETLNNTVKWLYNMLEHARLHDDVEELDKVLSMMERFFNASNSASQMAYYSEAKKAIAGIDLLSRFAPTVAKMVTGNAN